MVFSISVAIILVILLCLYYFIMLMPTNSIMSRAEKIFNGEIIADENDPLNRYNKDWSLVQNTRTKLSLRRSWVWHDGKKGYMNIVYTACYYDSTGDLVSGSWNVDSKWYIEKRNGKWEVVDIDELA